ncbi:MAG: hypothetical protein HY548_10250 [Elusimicrobia bacterium]|nr:hypothetical protein [Elusimicrobiota bacterium]
MQTIRASQAGQIVASRLSDARAYQRYLGGAILDGDGRVVGRRIQAIERKNDGVIVWTKR